jgi:F-type H+-transporting ATPase subunit alpha
MQVWEMALTLFGVNNGYFDDIEVAKALDAERALRDFARSNYAPLVEIIDRDKKLTKEVDAQLHELLKAFKKTGAY